MVLLVDIGNSNIMIGGAEGQTIVFQARLRTDTTKTSDEYAMELHLLLELHRVPLKTIEGAIVASVVPQVLNAMRTAIQKCTGHISLVVGPELPTGIKMAVDHPAQTGADLLVGSLAALREHPAPLIVLDMGTATTMVVLDGSGTFCGGCIAPGVKISLEALTERTALLPGLQLDQPQQAIGRNTMDCMRSGIMLGSACMIDGMVARMEEELGSKTTVIATGGIAKFIVPLCHTPILYDPNLILKGLAMLYWEHQNAQ